MDLFDKLTTAQAIDDYAELTSNSDGEDFYLEFKGIRLLPKGITIDRTEKQKLAKELCAFTNTYGGILCIHQNDLQGKQQGKRTPFNQVQLKTLLSSLETWTRDSLNPPYPMELKSVDGLILIRVNESNIKPHMSSLDKNYYYRHSSQSEKMPEVMIRALYREKDIFQVETDVAVSINQTKIFKKRQENFCNPPIHNRSFK